MRIRINDHLGPDDAYEALRADVLAGLTATPKTLPPKWFYDQYGSVLFDEITRLPEYYATRAEHSVLSRHAADVARASKATTLVELGSGTSEKTRLLLDALRDAGTLRRFIPFDVDRTILASAGAAIAEDYPGVQVEAVCGDFEHHLASLPRGGRRLVAFLGSTIGNLEPEPRARFLSKLAGSLDPGDSLLLGTDLVKEPARLVAAYDDAAGLTAAFNRNVLYVINRELKGDFDVESYDHVAVWNAEQEWIEMRLRAMTRQVVNIAELDVEVVFEPGEEVRTEVSAKFRPDRVEAELAAAGLTRTHWWTDPAGDFGVSLSVPICAGELSG